MSMEYLGYMIVMAGVTYFIRMLPLAVFQKEIKSVFLKSFLFYVPYAVLGAMTFPVILYSTDHRLSALGGMLAALVMAWRGKGLLSVAISAVLAVLLIEYCLLYI